MDEVRLNCEKIGCCHSANKILPYDEYAEARMPERMKTYVVQNGVQYIIRLNMQRDGLPFRDIVQLVDDLGGDIIAWDLVRAEDQKTIRDLTVLMGTAEKLQTLVEKLSLLEGVTVENVSDRTFLMHLGGKIEIRPRVHIKTRADLSHVYTPGVARVVEAIAEDPAKAFQLTMKRNTVAIVTDGSAILGLGNRGPKAALPVMEGKAVLFKWLADVDAIPICLDTNDVDEIVETNRCADCSGFWGN